MKRKSIYDPINCQTHEKSNESRKTIQGCTLLHVACSSGNFVMVELLSSADINRVLLPWKDSFTPPLYLLREQQTGEVSAYEAIFTGGDGIICLRCFNCFAIKLEGHRLFHILHHVHEHQLEMKMEAISDEELYVLPSESM
ncbi:hypothetical protein POM88_014685 [Heracleum sosnowskyi]|uniref:C2H2-type domain-containing protein n=1 Tax=Heracleum sosnowskyi TaxID=360622 RepID=A0AAD8MVN4_9APIA|nr:hypothetical protein POM88_014685 [Heracleum sosnowskyi]